MKVVLATSNKGKVREIIDLLHDREVFPYTEVIEGFEIIEDGDTFVPGICHKNVALRVDGNAARTPKKIF